MKNCVVKRNALRVRAIFLGSVLAVLVAAAPVFAQSPDQNYPTPITSNEISGEIRARDIGDSRQTTYFYTFDGSQGDLFVNIVSRNFNGDIDIFTLKDLRPLTKVVVYADLAENETGRVIYLRKPENLLLRVQGRTPNDDAATYRIKFAGSFVASSRQPGPDMPALPKVTAENETGIRVNSVGTILEVPKPSPSPVDEAIAKAEETVEKTVEPAAPPEEAKTEPDAAEKKTELTGETTPPAEPEKKVELVVTDTLSETPKAETPARNRRTARSRGRRNTRKPAPSKAEEKPAEEAIPESTAEPEARPTADNENAETAEPADPLANVRLVVLFKDGKRIERPMSEVFRFSVDKGTLTVVSKDGRIGRYPLLDISEVTIK